MPAVGVFCIPRYSQYPEEIEEETRIKSERRIQAAVYPEIHVEDFTSSLNGDAALFVLDGDGHEDTWERRVEQRERMGVTDLKGIPC